MGLGSRRSALGARLTSHVIALITRCVPYGFFVYKPGGNYCARACRERRAAGSRAHGNGAQASDDEQQRVEASVEDRVHVARERELQPGARARAHLAGRDKGQAQRRA